MKSYPQNKISTKVTSGHFLGCHTIFEHDHTSLKGYFHYRMITSQNVPSEAQVKYFSLFNTKFMFHSRDIQVLYFQPFHDLPKL